MQNRTLRAVRLANTILVRGFVARRKFLFESRVGKADPSERSDAEYEITLFLHLIIHGSIDIM